MEKIAVIFLCICSSVYAESRVLPPVIDNSTYPATSAPSNHTIHEVLGRLEQLQSELQQLRGIVEEQSQTIVGLKKRQGNIYSDLDLRIQELSGVDVSEKISQLAVNPQNADMIKDNSMIVATDSQRVVQYSVPMTSGSSIEAGVPKILFNQKNLYQAAYETLKNGHNTRAIAAFTSLLAKFPDSEYADNSQYWLGEAYKINQDTKAAKVAFTKVVSHYGESPKVPDALLKLGYMELEQNNIAKARDYLTQVAVSHPGTRASYLATKKLKLMATE
ncbi:MAG: tol-pal system protein YbgF [Methylococcales symbiont of Hymedesmia sp. n. MRB-2018]|nr:MAG: tol-pal system protein YbgF [Methylococcales symbiont of Hymedesmia sp. n. MRB-2018]